MRKYSFLMLAGLVALFALPSRVAAATFPSLPPSSGSDNALAPRHSSGIVYVADYARNVVDEFPAGLVKPKITATITNGINKPRDLFVDPSGNLYVVNDRPATVAVFARGQKIPNRVLSIPSTSPYANYITVGPDDTIYVSAYDAGEHYYIVEFDQGATSPSRTIDIPFYTQPCCNVVVGLATDSAGNLYVNEGESFECCGFGVNVYPPRALQPDDGFSPGDGFVAGALEIVGSEIYIGGENGVSMGQLPDPSTFQKIPIKNGGFHFAIDAVANYLYSTSYQKTVAIVNLTTFKTVGRLPGLEQPTGVAVDPPASLQVRSRR